MDLFSVTGGKKLRCGYTTGSCAAAAAKAAARMALTGEAAAAVSITTPRGVVLTLEIQDSTMRPGKARCAVVKDGGDDPDITNGLLVYADVALTAQGVAIRGGEGVGTVTKAGLACPVGEWAINPVPRRMICQALEDVGTACGYGGGFAVTISIPGGEEVAKKTFNPRLGIVGGLSILGTTGIVEPMSEKALVDTIRLEMDSRKAAGDRHLLAFFGNYGVDFSCSQLGVDVSRRVTISNYVGELLDYGLYCGFEDILLIGHLGKLVKVAQGIMNTHSAYADGRTSFLALAAMLCGASRKTGRAVYDAVTTDEAVRILTQEGLREAVMAFTCQKIEYYMEQRVHGEVQTGAVLFSNTYGVLGYTSRAKELLLHHTTREIL